LICLLSTTRSPSDLSHVSRAFPDTFTLMVLDCAILRIAASECVARLLTIPLGLGCATKIPNRMPCHPAFGPGEGQSLRNLRRARSEEHKSELTSRVD